MQRFPLPNRTEPNGTEPNQTKPNSSKKDVDEIIDDIWAKKATNDASKGSRSMLSDFFNDYLKNKYGMQAMVAKWAYSIMHALRQNVWDYTVEMFLLVLSGDLSEDVYHDANAMVGYFKKFCQRISDAEVDSATPGIVKKVCLCIRVCVFSVLSHFPLPVNQTPDKPPRLPRQILSRQEQGGHRHAEV